MSIILQYVVVRKDLLLKDFNWPFGAVIAQACHAVTAVTHMYHDDEHTKKYLENLDSMHKVVLEISNEKEIISLHEVLERDNIMHKLWIEQPENIPTCLVVKPYPKDEVKNYFKGLKLFKNP